MNQITDEQLEKMNWYELQEFISLAGRRVKVRTITHEKPEGEIIPNVESIETKRVLD